MLTLFAVINEAFKSTSDMALHKIATLTAAAHIEELVKLEEFVALEAMNGFTIRIIQNTIAADKIKEDLAPRNLELWNLSCVYPL
jgi:hypothetical protein